MAHYGVDLIEEWGQISVRRLALLIWSLPVESALLLAVQAEEGSLPEEEIPVAKSRAQIARFLGASTKLGEIKR